VRHAAPEGPVAAICQRTKIEKFPAACQPPGAIPHLTHLLVKFNVYAAGIFDTGEIETDMAYVIAEPCIGTKDTACVDACPVDCIHPKKDEASFEGADQLFIDPVECIDCGACVPVCPVSAIFALDDLPEKWKAYTEKNAKHYGR
jgi:NAD-dependent dihydropyrimidine dehydrogenase PreA subunit